MCPIYKIKHLYYDIYYFLLCNRVLNKGLPVFKLTCQFKI